MASVSRKTAFALLEIWSNTGGDPQTIAAQNIPDGLNSEDAAFARELFFGCIKLKRKLDYCIDSFVRSRKIPRPLRNILRLGVYQLLEALNIPHYAVVDETVELAREPAEARGPGFVNAVLRHFIRYPHKVHYPDRETNPIQFLGITCSYPDWLVRRYLQRFGFADTQRLLEAGNLPAPVCIHANESLISCDEMKDELIKAGVVFNELKDFPGHFIVGNPPLLFRCSIINEGKIIIADPAQSIAPRALSPGVGGQVWDIFAAPGGKTAALSLAVGRNGTVIASDVSLERARLLKSNILRWRLENVHILCGDILQFAIKGKLQYILADVPCSGTGTLRRNPDLRWRLRKEVISTSSRKQAEYLDLAASRLAAGGKLVYSTCSIELEENEMVMQNFLHRNQGCRRATSDIHEHIKNEMNEWSTLPFRDNVDGVFVSVIERI